MQIYRTLAWSVLALGVGVTGCSDLLGSSNSAATNPDGGAKNGGIRGAIFTTTVDGTRVNANIYAAKQDVYLDGGPRGGSPSNAASLAEGDYYFQVTDPSGKHLLSTDDIACRKIHVSDDGVIVSVATSACQHATGIDSDYASLGAITVQLMPFADTPNPGGEYKVWVTPVAQYTGEFENRFSKTDNFKIGVPDEDLPVCGDGVVDSGEQCDDGNSMNGDGCTSTCTHEEVTPPCCGDGVTEGGEQCDDGNSTNGDGCSSTCVLEIPVCGNHTVESGEACDDGNTSNGDGCSSLCQVEHVCVCGDGAIDAGEACDDGNVVNGDGCSATCQIEVHVCVCGDGLVEAPEACDDGNVVSGDGCSATCQIEVPPAPVCGDGHLDAGEACDDGNLVNGDGCSSVCTTEAPPCGTCPH